MIHKHRGKQRFYLLSEAVVNTITSQDCATKHCKTVAVQCEKTYTLATR